MIKYTFVKIILFSALILSPAGLVFAAYNNITYTSDTTVSFSTLSPSTTVTIKAGANVNNLVVNSTSMVITLERSSAGPNSSITLAAGDTVYTINQADGSYAACGSTPVSYTFTGPSTTGTSTITITPKLCSSITTSGGGSGGGNSYGGGGSTTLTSTPTQTPTTTPIPTPAPALVPTSNPSPAPALTPTVTLTPPPILNNTIVLPKFIKVLSVGSMGKSVANLQEFLKSQGTDIYPEGIISGKFGLATKRALQRFQLKYGIVKNGGAGYGRFGPKTMAMINRLLGF